MLSCLQSLKTKSQALKSRGLVSCTFLEYQYKTVKNVALNRMKHLAFIGGLTLKDQTSTFIIELTSSDIIKYTYFLCNMLTIEAKKIHQTKSETTLSIP